MCSRTIKLLLSTAAFIYGFGLSQQSTNTVTHDTEPTTRGVTTVLSAIGQSRVDDVTAMTSSAGNDSVLKGDELMEYLFETGFHRDVMDQACYDKLKQYGYWPRLNFFQRFCLCRLLCMAPHVSHKLDDLDKKRVAKARKVESKVKSNEVRFGQQLPLTVGIVTASAILIVVGVVGNSLVLITVAKFMAKPSVIHVFLCSIACSDLLVNLICLPILIYKRLAVTSTNIHLCRTMNLFFYMSLGCSIFSMLVMSIDRYLVIRHPLKTQAIRTSKRLRMIVIAVWLTSTATAIPYVYFTRSISNCAVVVPAGLWFRLFVSIAGLVLYLIPVVIMLFGYSSIGVLLCRKGEKEKRTGEESKDNETKSSTRDGSLIKTLILVLVVFILCWTPYWWYYSLLSFGVLDKTLTSKRPLYEKIILEYSVLVVAAANSSLNPILYAFTSRAFRKGFKSCLVACCRKRHTYNIGQDSTTVTECSEIATPDASSPLKIN